MHGCSYWDGFGAGYHDPASFIERSKLLIDSINAWHSRTNDFNVRTGTVHAHTPS